jgi:hypothetical protein
VCLGDTLGVYRLNYPPHPRGHQRLTLHRYGWGGNGWLLISRLHRLVKEPGLRRLVRPSGDGVWGCG